MWASECLQNVYMYSQRKLLEILLNQTEIKLYIPFSDWFGTKRTSVWFQIIRKIVYTIWFQFDSSRFRKDFSVCTVSIFRGKSTENKFAFASIWIEQMLCKFDALYLFVTKLSRSFSKLIGCNLRIRQYLSVIEFSHCFRFRT